MDEVRFSQRPYKVTYYDMKGERKEIRRVPPKKMHDILPTDIVEIKNKHSDDFDAGEKFEVKSINPRHPNVVQIQDDDAEHSTFMHYFDLELKEEVAESPSRVKTGSQKYGSAESTRYLLWP